MTKPVQIPDRPIIAKAAIDIERNWCDCSMRSVDERYAAIFGIIQKAADAESQAALLQVRSLLEAKAKEWQERDIREYQGCQELNARMLRGEVVTMTASIGYVGCPSPNRHVAELLSLAATLGNQGK